MGPVRSIKNILKHGFPAIGNYNCLLSESNNSCDLNKDVMFDI